MRQETHTAPHCNSSHIQTFHWLRHKRCRTFQLGRGSSSSSWGKSYLQRTQDSGTCLATGRSFPLDNSCKTLTPPAPFDSRIFQRGTTLWTSHSDSTRPSDTRCTLRSQSTKPLFHSSSLCTIGALFDHSRSRTCPRGMGNPFRLCNRNPSHTGCNCRDVGRRNRFATCDQVLMVD